ncbi:helix-turn-helix domain-containing protein [Micromonospora qiuiae]|nr:helix-turn-helix transcriptional regulator [Micromonospora qiuiae]
MEVHDAVAYLIGLGLLRHQSGDRFVAVPPHEAAEHVLRPLEHELRARRAEIDDVRDRLRDFVPLFEAERPSLAAPAPVQRVESLAAARALIAELSEACTDEILNAQPGNGRSGGLLEEAALRHPMPTRDGVRIRLLHQHAARLHAGVRAHLDRVRAAGAEVRTIGDEFGRLLVFDRTAALIEAPDSPAVAVIRNADVVGWMAHQYERLWQAAEPYRTGPDAQAGIAQGLTDLIARLLSEGLTDAAVARRLGLSVRTCRRYVADMMASLGSESRFQAGYLLASRELRGLSVPPALAPPCGGQAPQRGS